MWSGLNDFTYYFETETRKFKGPWKILKKVGNKIGDIFGGGDDDDDAGYPMYKRDEKEEGQ